MSELLSRYDVEHTDTYGGEANYCWVNRRTIKLASPADPLCKRHRAKVKRLAKAAVGLTGVLGTWDDYGDQLTFRPRGLCQIIFVNWHDCGAASNCDQHG